MEVIVLSKCKQVEKPYWLFCKEVGLVLDMTVFQIHKCIEADYYWRSLASNVYKLRVKEIKDKIKSGETVRYKVLTILRELCQNEECRNDYIPNRLNNFLALSTGKEDINYDFNI